MLCEYDCRVLVPSQDSTTVVLLLLTSCRGSHRQTDTTLTQMIATMRRVCVCAGETHHHEVELAVGRADGLETEGDLAEVAAVDSGQRGRDPDAEGQVCEVTRG